MKLDINIRPQADTFTIIYDTKDFINYLAYFMGWDIHKTKDLLIEHIETLSSIIPSNCAWNLMTKEIGWNDLWEAYDREDIYQAHDDLTNLIIDDILNTFDIFIEKKPTYRE